MNYPRTPPGLYLNSASLTQQQPICCCAEAARCVFGAYLLRHRLSRQQDSLRLDLSKCYKVEKRIAGLYAIGDEIL